MKAQLKEWLRKQTVSLKRNPHYIPLVFLVICCLVYTFNLTDISNATAALAGIGMGFSCFVIVLCSILSIITFIQAFPKRQPQKKVSIILTIIMMVISIGLDIYYWDRINYATVRRTDPPAFKITAKFAYIYDVETLCFIHAGLCLVTIVLILMIPLFKKWLSKIDTSVKLEVTEVETIDVSDEE